jgi:hypothetical protein
MKRARPCSWRKQQAAWLAADKCEARGCRRKLSLVGASRRSVAFRCFYCCRLYCDRHARSHFGNLDGFSQAKSGARRLMRALSKWLKHPLKHA